MKIVILGSSSTSLASAPWYEPGTEFWASASFYRDHPQMADRVDCWFELHPHIEQLSPGWLDWAIENQPRCFLRDRNEQLDNSHTYPIEIIAERFGSYFTSSVAYMLAYAIEQGAEWIGLYGVDMATMGEHLYQKANCEHLLGVALGAGVEVMIPETSPLLHTEFMYGYESPQIQEQDWCFMPDITGYIKQQEKQ